MSISAAYEAFLAACEKDGCPLCRAEHDADLRHLDRFFYQLVNDYGARVQLRASLGFCLDHSKMAMDELQGKALGLAILYEDMLRIAGEQLAQSGELTQPQGKCQACENHADVRKWLLTDLSKHILEETSQTAIKNSQGFCLPHLRLAFEHLRGPEKRAALLTLQRQRIESLRAELLEYIRKNDYRFAGEPFGSERDAWRRAVEMVVGK
jgi:hypothetical protein